MISIVVPVYRVEPYLEQCLDSILSQTYRDIEILLIDDGSPDRCGEICDRYAEADPRIRVFHTENRGLSAARNLGIDHAKGEYLGFVDSDDWIEPDMYERLLHAAEESRADIAVCGRFREYPDQSRILLPEARVLEREAAVRALVLHEIKNASWDKLYRRACFDGVRFPVGRVNEDVSTTYRTFLQAERVVSIAVPLYHYRMRKGSIMEEKGIRYFIDNFASERAEYEGIMLVSPYNTDREITDRLLSYCASAAVRLWANYNSASPEERKKYDREMQEAARFVRTHYSLSGPRGWSAGWRCALIPCRHAVSWAFTAAEILSRFYKLFPQSRGVRRE